MNEKSRIYGLDLTLKIDFFGWGKGHIFGTSHLFYFTWSDHLQTVLFINQAIKERSLYWNFTEDSVKLLTAFQDILKGTFIATQGETIKFLSILVYSYVAEGVKILLAYPV